MIIQKTRFSINKIATSKIQSSNAKKVLIDQQGPKELYKINFPKKVPTTNQ
jgi:hypothetical protein